MKPFRTIAGALLTFLALAACAAPADETEGAESAVVEGPSRAVCGAEPYVWKTGDSLGDVLERQPKGESRWLELKVRVFAAGVAGAIKTRRSPKYSTKSEIVRYKTQDRGKFVEATTFLAYPDDRKARTYPIMLLLHGTAGFNDACAPSKSDDGAKLASMLASLGYVVVAPDYLGLKSLGEPTGFPHPYLVAEPTAIASLDAVRAAKKAIASDRIRLGDLVVIGGSQGGHAAAFVNRYAPHYAPELAIKGSVWDVPPTDIVGQAKAALSEVRPSTKNLVAIATSYTTWYGDPEKDLGNVLTESLATSIPAKLAQPHHCGAVKVGDGMTVSDLFTPAFIESGARRSFAGDDDRFSCYLRENSLPYTSVPKRDATPSLFLLGEKDELVDNAVERASFEKLCSGGHALQYLECAGATHTKPLLFAFDQWLDFLDDRLAGKPLEGTCTVRPAERCTSTP